ncbi:MAG TPA: TatD family hydrolase [Williamwhitmania sp.]|nr:TatD family hydrolase [Williamwhitmania sp.]
MLKTIDIHTHRYHQDAFICLLNVSSGDIVDDHPRLYYSAGIHPWRAAIHGSSEIEWLGQLIQENKKVIALGEIGLDKACNVENSIQLEVFEKQLAIAEALRTPVIIHNVRATNEILAIQNRMKHPTPFIFHGFRGKFTKAEAILDAGNYLSFGAALHTNDNATADSLRRTPTNQLFLETDDASVSIASIYSKAAEIKGISTEQLISEIWNNFASLFKISIND